MRLQSGGPNMKITILYILYIQKAGTHEKISCLLFNITDSIKGAENDELYFCFALRWSSSPIHAVSAVLHIWRVDSVMAQCSSGCSARGARSEEFESLLVRDPRYSGAGLLLSDQRVTRTYVTHNNKRFLEVFRVLAPTVEWKVMTEDMVSTTLHFQVIWDMFTTLLQ